MNIYVGRKMKNLLIFFVFSFVNKTQTMDSADFYTAAVVDYMFEYDKSDTPRGNVARSVKYHEEYIKQAHLKKADIIVFPELSLTSFLETFSNLDEYVLFSTALPNITANNEPNPCNDTKVIDIVSEYVHRLSCSAQENRIYVVINLPERESHGKNISFYNTNIVFDRNGHIIAKYRKYNLFMEPYNDQPEEAEKITFVTDFGVKFGMFICFDILFHSPAQRLVYDENVTDIIFSTAWMSELPFLTAIQVQAGWSRAHGVNLLAANYVRPENALGGSGIYSAKKGILKSFMPSTSQSTLLVHQVPKLKTRVTLEYSNYGDHKKEYYGADLRVPGLKPLNQNLKHFSHRSVQEPVTSAVLKSNNLECNFDVVFEELSLNATDYQYKLVAFEGKTQWGNQLYPVQTCSIIACINDTLNSCGALDESGILKLPKFKNITITGNFANDDDTVIFPATLTYLLHSLPFNNYSYFKTNGKTVISLNSPSEHIITFGIFAHTQPNGSAYLNANFILIFMTTLLLCALTINQVYLIV